jgi:hypothetical protein
MLVQTVLETLDFYQQQQLKLQEDLIFDRTIFPELRSLHLGRSEILRKVIREQRNNIYDVYVTRINNLKKLKHIGVFEPRHSTLHQSSSSSQVYKSSKPIFSHPAEFKPSSFVAYQGLQFETPKVRETPISQNESTLRTPKLEPSHPEQAFPTPSRVD